MREKERLPHTLLSRRELLWFMSIFAGCAVTGGTLAYFSNTNNGVHISVPSDSTAKKTGKARYLQEFKEASPARKYAMDYLQTQSIYFPPYSDTNSPNQDYKVVHFNNGCLGDTAYDIYPSSATATVHPEVNPQNPDQLEIVEVGTNTVVLVFNGLKHAEALQPANEQTRNTISPYGCKLGFTGISHISG